MIPSQLPKRMNVRSGVIIRMPSRDSFLYRTYEEFVAHKWSYMTFILSPILVGALLGIVDALVDVPDGLLELIGIVLVTALFIMVRLIEDRERTND